MPIRRQTLEMGIPYGDAAGCHGAGPANTSHPRRRLRFAPTLGAAMVMAAAGIALYWQMFVHGDSMRAQAGSIHEMAATTAAAPIVAPQETQTPQADAVSADASTPASAPAISPAQASVASSVDADAPTIGEFSPAPVPLPRIDQTWLLADILDDAAYSAAAAPPSHLRRRRHLDAGADDLRCAGFGSVLVRADAPTIGEFSPVPVPPPRVGQTWALADILVRRRTPPPRTCGCTEENNPVSGPSGSAIAETPVQTVTHSPEAAPAIGPPAGNPPGVAVVQREPITRAMPHHDATLPVASAPVRQAEAPANGTPIPDESQRKSQRPGADGVAAPHTDLPGAPAASLEGRVVKATAATTVSTRILHRCCPEAMRCWPLAIFPRRVSSTSVPLRWAAPEERRHSARPTIRRFWRPSGRPVSPRTATWRRHGIGGAPSWATWRVPAGWRCLPRSGRRYGHRFAHGSRCSRSGRTGSPCSNSL